MNEINKLFFSVHKRQVIIDEKIMKRQFHFPVNYLKKFFQKEQKILKLDMISSAVIFDIEKF